MIQKALYRLSKSFSRRNLYEYLSKAIIEKKIINCENILSVGSGGEITDCLRKQKLTFTSIDIDPARNPDIVMDITNMDKISSNSIDVIFCMEVLEHVKEPLKACSEIFRVLKPNGLLIGSTPFMLGIHDSPFDYYRYTYYGIKEIFKDFEQIEICKRNKYFHTLYTLVLRLYVVSSERDKRIMTIVFPFILVAYPAIWFLDKLISSNDITTGYFFIFKKSI